MQSTERSESSRDQGDRIGALEQDMKVVRYQLTQWDRRHENSPERLVKLEQQFANQTEKLDEMEAGISKIDVAVEKLGAKIAWGIGAGAAFMVMFDKLWPLLTKGLAS